MTQLVAEVQINVPDLSGPQGQIDALNQSLQQLEEGGTAATAALQPMAASLDLSSIQSALDDVAAKITAFGEAADTAQTQVSTLGSESDAAAGQVENLGSMAEAGAGALNEHQQASTGASEGVGQLGQQVVTAAAGMLGLEGAVTSAGVSLAGMAGPAAAAGVAIAATVGAITTFNDTVGGLMRLSDQFGITAVQAQAFGTMIESTGGNADSANTMLMRLTMGLSQAQNQIELGHTATGRFVDGLSLLGLSATDASGHIETIGNLMPEIIDRFTAIHQAGGDAAGGINLSGVAMDLFGRSGAQAIPMLEQLGIGYDEATQDAAGFGEGSAANTQKYLAEQVAMTKLHEEVTNLAVDLGGELVPILTAVANGLDGLVQHADQASAVLTTVADLPMVSFFLETGKAIGTASDFLNDMNDKASETPTPVQASSAAFTGLNSVLGDFIDKGGQVSQINQQVPSDSSGVASGVGVQDLAWSGLISVLSGVESQTRNTINALNDLADVGFGFGDKLKNPIDDAAKAIDALSTKLTDNADRAQVLEQQATQATAQGHTALSAALSAEAQAYTDNDAKAEKSAETQVTLAQGQDSFAASMAKGSTAVSSAATAAAKAQDTALTDQASALKSYSSDYQAFVDDTGTKAQAFTVANITALNTTAANYRSNASDVLTTMSGELDDINSAVASGNDAEATELKSHFQDNQALYTSDMQAYKDATTAKEDALKEWEGLFSKPSTEENAYTQEIDQVKLSLAEWQAANQPLLNSINDQISALHGSGTAISDQRTALEGQKTAIEATKQPMADQLSQLQASRDALTTQRTAMDDGAKAADGQSVSIKTLATDYATGLPAVTAFNSAIAGTAPNTISAAGALTSGATSAAGSLTSGASTSAADLIAGGQGAASAMTSGASQAASIIDSSQPGGGGGGGGGGGAGTHGALPVGAEAQATSLAATYGPGVASQYLGQFGVTGLPGSSSSGTPGRSLSDIGTSQQIYDIQKAYPSSDPIGDYIFRNGPLPTLPGHAEGGITTGSIATSAGPIGESGPEAIVPLSTGSLPVTTSGAPLLVQVTNQQPLPVAMPGQLGNASAAATAGSTPDVTSVVNQNSTAITNVSASLNAVGQQLNTGLTSLSSAQFQAASQIVQSLNSVAAQITAAVNNTSQPAAATAASGSAAASGVNSLGGFGYMGTPAQYAAAYGGGPSYAGTGGYTLPGYGSQQFQSIPGDPGSSRPVGMQSGGIVMQPELLAMLHGPEAVIPLSGLGGGSGPIQVQIVGFSGAPLPVDTGLTADSLSSLVGGSQYVAQLLRPV